ERFKVMEHKLYLYIMAPAAILTTLLGLWLMEMNWNVYIRQHWLHAKLALVLLLWIYHLYCGHIIKLFAQEKNPFTSKFYRWFNEVPSLLLIGIVILVVVKPQF